MVLRQKSSFLKQYGFTIVELMVGIAITGLLSIVLVSLMVAWIGQASVSNVRNAMTSNLQTALTRVSDDIRTSSNPALCNLVPDINAPQSLTGTAANVPCPEDPANSNQQTFWRLTNNQLIINRTPQTVAGEQIYDDPITLAGKRDTIVYYVRDGALYKRIIAAPYTTPMANAVSTNTCPIIVTGGCGTDTKIVDGLDTSAAEGPFVVTYYNVNGEVIAPSDTDYTGFVNARSVSVKIKMKQDKNGQEINRDSTMRMQFRGTQAVLASPPVVTPPTVPGVPSVGMLVGSGGVTIASFSEILGNPGVYVRGKMSLTDFAKVGEELVPIEANVSNIACGDASNYPILCDPSSKPINLAGTSRFYGPVCATGQPASSGVPGLVVGCIPPDVQMPAFDKANFVAGLSGGSTVSTFSCPFAQSVTLPPNTTYTGTSNPASSCSIIVGGNLYFKQALNIASFTEIRVPESVGRNRPIIVVNGRIDMDSFTKIIPNSQGTTPFFISFYSSDATCSSSDSCTSLSSAKQLETINANSQAIKLDALTGSSSTFYAYYGEVYMGAFTRLGSVGGQKVRMTSMSKVQLTGEF